MASIRMGAELAPIGPLAQRRRGRYQPWVPTVDVVIPALNEEQALPQVLAEIPSGEVRRVVVADNGSTDRTAEVAEQTGAEVVREPERGYGAACLRALSHMAEDPPDIVVFLDGDGGDHPEELRTLVAPIERDEADLVIGSRTLGKRERGSLTPQQLAGNAIACAALRLMYGVRYTDLGPFRAIRWSSLERLGMVDRNFGWTVEMQIKAAKLDLRTREVPVSYRHRRAGRSKVSGTIRGTLGASAKITWTLLRHA
jgi:glycosyltransferase involved in cell wall biosynthesis